LSLCEGQLCQSAVCDDCLTSPTDMDQIDRVRQLVADDYFICLVCHDNYFYYTVSNHTHLFAIVLDEVLFRQTNARMPPRSPLWRITLQLMSNESQVMLGWHSYGVVGGAVWRLSTVLLP
jgi:hypothetical protein